MEIYDSRYFVYNKRFQTALGVWPYQSRVKNAIICGFLLLVMIALVVPQIIRLKMYIGKDKDKSMENVFGLFYIFAIYVKLFTAVYAEDRLKILYESTARNFQIYTDKMEKKILHENSERGRLITLVFIMYMMTALIVFILLPMYPIMTDVIVPLDHPRARMFILNGDYLVDRDEYYFQIYVFESTSAALTVFILCSTDPMYAAIVEHCLGLFCICKYRLNNFNKPRRTEIIEKANAESQVDEYAYTALVEAIQLHKNILKYTKIIQTSYSLYFLLEMGATMGLLTSTSIIIVMKLYRPLDCIRYFLVLIGLLLHIFFLSWPGQKLINVSGDIFQDTYHNDWYESSLRCQRLLRFMSLNCSKPCQLSGGGLYVMNFVNFARILKTSASYITVFSSF
ncbi:odorant receptor 132 [Nasonia vitripennis]|uniref:Odorant receptor n=1 Tax=Nasonia vitripennis TaxID=7425 RepID=A0A7M6W5W0_NASVI|nr:odorant receptor 132 [Nasonia vitripennis]